MANDRILLNARAKKAGIANYRQLSLADLKVAVDGANGHSAPAKGKSAPAPAVKGKASPKPTITKGKATTAKPPVKGKATVSKPPVKGKTATKRPTAPAKSTVRKPATPVKGKTAAKGTAKRLPVKSTVTPKPVARTSSAKGKATVSERPRATVVKAGEGFRNRIDLRRIDWKQESRVGSSGKRAEVLSALRKTKDYGKAFELLKDRAKAYYKGKTKAEAEHMLVWLIARVAYDFCVSTGQHEPGARQAYGTRDATATRHAKLKKEGHIVTPKGKTPAKPAAKKVAPVKAKAAPAARKPTAKRTAASKMTRKTTAAQASAKAKAPTRKPAAKAPVKTAARKAPVSKGRTIKGRR